MENLDCGNSTTKINQDVTGDPDYSLNELFKENWNLTDNKINIQNPSTSTSNVEESQSPDPDNTLNDYFKEDWSYNPTQNHLVTFGTANFTSTNLQSKWQNTSNSHKSMEEREKAAAKMLIQSYLTRIERKDTSTILDIIQRESAEAFSLLLNSNYELVPLNEKEQTALHLIFHRNAWYLLDVLDSKFSNYPETLNRINLKDSKGLTHLHVACVRGSLKLVERFLSNKDDVNACYNSDRSNVYSGFTPLHFAVINPQVCKKEIIAKLIELGANVHAVDSEGRTPLHIASRVYENKKNSKSDKKLNVEVMDILVKHQPDVSVKDVDGNTPLLSAFLLRYREFEMEESSSTPYTDEYKTYKISRYMVETKRKLQFFLDHGADVTAINKKKENVLHLILKSLKMYRYELRSANYKFNDSDHLDMIKKILAANPKFDINFENDEGETPLQMAVACMSLRIVELLLDRGADLTNLNFKVKRERDFFCYADMVPIFEPVQDLTDVLDFLRDRGFNLSMQDNIMILKFLLHDDESCNCVNDTTFKNVKLVLHYGTKSHIKNVLSRLSNDLQNDTKSVCSDDSNYSDYTLSRDWRSDFLGELASDSVEYLWSVELADIHRDRRVIRRVRDIVEGDLNEECNLPADKMSAIDKDLEQLKAVKFENDVNLHDILKKDPEDTPRAIVNDFDLEMIEKLGCYKVAVKGHITKARVRFFFERYSSNHLKLIYDSLPDVCCRMIVRYLSNKDILNLSLATIPVLTLTKQNL